MYYQLANNVFKNVTLLGNEYPEMIRKIYVFHNCVYPTEKWKSICRMVSK